MNDTHVFRDPANNDRLIDYTGIIVARVPDIVEQMWPGLSDHVAHSLKTFNTAPPLGKGTNEAL